MANIGAYSRHKFFSEMLTPLYTNAGDGANPLVYSPGEQQTKAFVNLTNDLTAANQLTIMGHLTDALTDAGQLEILGNLSQAAALPTGAAITTGATTALTSHYKTSPVSGVIKLTCTAFAVGTAGDGAALAIGASLISFPTGTLVRGIDLTGTLSVVGNDYTNAVVFGLGTTIGSGAVGVLNGTAAFHSVMTEQTSGSLAASGANSVIAVVAPHGAGSPVKQVRLTTTTPGLAVFLNAAATWTNVATAGALTFTGTVGLEYVLV